MQSYPKTSGSSVRPKVPQAKHRLTHFLSLPIGHHPALQERWTRITKALVEPSTKIPGLDESIILKPGSLHITLGVLSLVSRPSDRVGNVAHENEADVLEEASERRDTSNSNLFGRGSTSGSPSSQQHTIEDALCLLRTLKDPIRLLLDNSVDNGDKKLRVPLERLDVMRSRPNQSLEKVHVMWAGPDLDTEAGKRLKGVCDLVHSTFKNAGMLQDNRPLKIHCTLVNAKYRKESRAHVRENNSRNMKSVPFSFASLVASPAFARMVSTSDATPEVGREPQKIDLGSWVVNEVQLCEMAGKDHAGVYRSVGAIAL